MPKDDTLPLSAEAVTDDQLRAILKDWESMPNMMLPRLAREVLSLRAKLAERQAAQPTMCSVDRPPTTALLSDNPLVRALAKLDFPFDQGKAHEGFLDKSPLAKALVGLLDEPVGQAEAQGEKPDQSPLDKAFDALLDEPGVHVVQANDFPEVAFTSREEAVAFRRAKEAEAPTRRAPRIYWNLFRFKLRLDKDGVVPAPGQPVFVVMENDFPFAVCATKDLADRVCEEQKAKLRAGPPRVYWRSCQVTLQATAADALARSRGC